MEKNTLQNALNEFSQGTTDNIDSIMIKDAAGKQYWMKKADLASVLGGLMNNHLAYRGNAIGDANNIMNPGIYSIFRTENNVSNVNLNYGLMIVFGDPGTFIGQKTMNVNSESYERVYTVSTKTWSQWKII